MKASKCMFVFVWRQMSTGVPKDLKIQYKQNDKFGTKIIH